ncbi:MAG: CxxC-x17-CxxC domain-containing protein [Candidatus Shapirobacteria bacterium]
MNKYFGQDRGGNFRNSGRRDFGDRNREDRQMFQAVCSECGRDCQVPFRPTGEKPVYCSSCFEKMGNSSNNSRSYSERDNSRNRDFGPRNYEQKSYEPRNFGTSPNKDQLAAIGAKLDKIIALLTPVQPKIKLEAEEAPVKVKKAKKVKKEPTLLG